MARQIDCPSCGASVKYRGGDVSATCKYCGNSVIIPPELRGRARYTGTGQTSASGCGKSAAVVAGLGVLLAVGGAALVFYIAQSSAPGENKPGIISAITGGLPVELEFGGAGSGRGYFQDAECIAVDGRGYVYVGEWETGRVQVFDEGGEFVDQWHFAQPEDFYLMAMSADDEGNLYMVYDSELQIHDGLTGNYLGNLYHPEGWGYDDVDVSPGGEVLASWCCGSDDLIIFSADGTESHIIQGAISGVTGDSELDALVAAGNMGESYMLGSFNSVVVVYDAHRKFTDRFGNDEIFTMPFGMDVDPRGNIWVSDFGDLLVFSPSGELLNTIVTDNGMNDFVIDDDLRLWGITNDDTVVMIDISEY